MVSIENPDDNPIDIWEKSWKKHLLQIRETKLGFRVEAQYASSSVRSSGSENHSSPLVSLSPFFKDVPVYSHSFLSVRKREQSML